MRVTVGYKATSSVDLPILVSYTCSKCRCRNIDDSQKIHVECTASGRLWDNKLKLQETANSSVKFNVNRILEAARNKDFRELNLTCCCKFCGNKEVWASYFPMNTFLKKCAGLFSNPASFWIAFFVVIWPFFFLDQNISWIVCLLELCLIAFPFVRGAVKNAIVSKKVLQLKDENLPRIAIRANITDNSRKQ